MVDLGEAVAMDWEAAPAAGPAHVEPLELAFWNAQHISDKAKATKADIAHALRAYASEVILCEGVGALAEFELITPVQGIRRARKLKTLVFREHVVWSERDTMGVVYRGGGLEQYRGLMQATVEECIGAALRRPLLGSVDLDGDEWGLAALHAPAGGFKNKSNLTTLYATMAYLQHLWPNRWVFFGDLNLDPTVADAEHRNILSWWLLTYVQQIIGCQVQVKQGGPTHGRPPHTSVLDYALCPAAVAGSVTVTVLNDFADVSDHIPIHVKIEP